MGIHEVMKSAYFHSPTRTIADVMMDRPGVAWITRINVPHTHRGKGHGSRILQAVLEDADRYEIRLFLAPSATGGLTQEELIDWYERHGFNWIQGDPNDDATGWMVREPRTGLPGRPAAASPGDAYRWYQSTFLA